MFLYYLRLAMISIRRNPILSGLMVAAIGLGIGAFMTIVTINYSMSGNPIPEKSDVLFAVQLDNWDPNKAFYEPNYPPTQLTYLDAMALMKAKRAVRQTANSGAALVIEAQGGEAKPFSVRGRANFSDFFPMFNVPFIYGAGWDTGADDAREQVVVVSREINDRVFGGENSVGRTLRMSGHDFRVTGVIDNWNPAPKFYDLTTGAFNQTEEVFVPFNLIARLELTRSGNNNCWKMPDGAGLQAYLNSECVWIQYWAELRSEDAKADYLAFLDSYVGEQKLLGRFPRPLNNDLHNVVEWIEYMEVVPDEARFLLAVASMFLLVCLLNTLGLLLAKFVGKAPEIGLRRALGASKRTLFIQHLVEASCIGVAGGLLGLALAWAGLRGIDALLAGHAARLIEMDWVMVTTAVFMALLSSLVAGLYPTWRACNVAPATQLKSS
jgi:putative ABC transport system permease protein